MQFSVAQKLADLYRETGEACNFDDVQRCHLQLKILVEMKNLTQLELQGITEINADHLSTTN